MEMFLFFQNRKVINIAYANGFHAKKNFLSEKNSSYTNLFATLAHVKICLHRITTLTEFEGLPAKTWKILRGNFS